jgi:hypothetical protein
LDENSTGQIGRKENIRGIGKEQKRKYLRSEESKYGETKEQTVG